MNFSDVMWKSLIDLEKGALNVSEPTRRCKIRNSLKIRSQYNVEKFLPGIPGVFDIIVSTGRGEFDNVTQTLGGEFNTVWDRWV